MKSTKKLPTDIKKLSRWAAFLIDCSLQCHHFRHFLYQAPIETPWYHCILNRCLAPLAIPCPPTLLKVCLTRRKNPYAVRVLKGCLAPKQKHQCLFFFAHAFEEGEDHADGAVDFRILQGFDQLEHADHVLFFFLFGRLQHPLIDLFHKWLHFREFDRS